LEFLFSDKKVIFRADNKNFLSRIYRGQQSIEAAKEGVDVFCEFSVENGSIVPIREDIESVSWGKYEVPSDVKPTVLGMFLERNDGWKCITKKVAFEKTVEATQETNWDNNWGITKSDSYAHKIVFEVL